MEFYQKMLMMFLTSALFVSSAGQISAQTDIFEQTNGPTGGTVKALAVNSAGEIFAGTAGGIFRSGDGGTTWTTIQSLQGIQTEALKVHSNGSIFAGIYYGIWRSTDNGDTWEEVNNGLTTGPIVSFAINSNGDIFAGAQGAGIFRSTDNGDTWVKKDNGIALPTIISALAINSNGDIFAAPYVGAAKGVFRSSDNGDNWTQIDNGLTGQNARSLAIGTSGEVFAGTSQSLFRSSNNGDDWTELYNGLPNSEAFYVLGVNSAGEIFAGTSNSLFFSSNSGDTWTNLKLTDKSILSLTLKLYNEIFAGIVNEGVYLHTTSINPWIQINNGLIATSVDILVTDSSGMIFTSTPNSRIFRSEDNGDSWTLINNGLRSTASTNGLAINSKGEIFAATSDELFRSSNMGTTWNQLTFNMGFEAVTVNSADEVLAGTASGEIYRFSSEVNPTKTKMDTGTNSTRFSEFALGLNEDIFAGTIGNWVLRSKDNGETWQMVNSGLADSWILSLAVNSKGDVFAGTLTGVFLSTDNGGTWNLKNSGIGETRINSIAINSLDQAYAGTFEGLFVSNDNGESWMQTNEGLINRAILALNFNSNGTLFVGTAGNGVFRSVESPVPVELSSFSARLTDNTIHLLWRTESELNNFGFEIQRKLDTAWNVIGFLRGFGTVSEPKTYEFLDKIEHRATSFSSIKYRLRQIDTDGSFDFTQAITIFFEIPKTIKLNQNYPNPFNPSTTISYSIPNPGWVTLKIYNIKGSEVATLVNSKQKVGNHFVSFDASGLANGIYYYRLQIGEFIHTKKLTFVK